MKNKIVVLISCLTFFFWSGNGIAQDLEKYDEYQGTVVNQATNESLIFASLTVIGTNISVVTNSDGEFLLKIPQSLKDVKVLISFLGFQSKEMALTEFNTSNQKIGLLASTITLSEINIVLPKSAKYLVKKVFELRENNNFNDPTIMTAFYRETIKKGRKNASLAEAIVTIYKEPYMSTKNDRVGLFKSRKSTDYSKLDTLALKLQGGPFNALFIDLMKYPEYVFTEETMKWYDFSFGPSTTVNNQPVFVVNFEQLRGITEPLFKGKLFIDAKTYALTSAVYNLNITDNVKTDNMFVTKKPGNVTVYPTEALYRVDYREKEGKWYYGYSNVQISFKIKKKRSWFSKNYSLMSEMAITDWSYNTDKEKISNRDKMKTSIIISDETSGFSDPEFWGAYNVIEPEKSIESAIEKIKKQLEKAKRS